MTKIAEKAVKPAKEMACVISFGASVMVGILSACNTTSPRASTENKAAKPSVAASISPTQSDYATNPIETAIPRADNTRGISPSSPGASGVAYKSTESIEDSDVLVGVTDTARPWVVLKSIGFFYHRSDLATWEAAKIIEIVEYIAQHPGVEVGINSRVGALDGDRSSDPVSQLRIHTICAALLAAGVAPERIRVGTYIDRPASLDQQVEVFVRHAR